MFNIGNLRDVIESNGAFFARLPTSINRPCDMTVSSSCALQHTEMTEMGCKSSVNVDLCKRLCRLFRESTSRDDVPSDAVRCSFDCIKAR